MQDMERKSTSVKIIFFIVYVPVILSESFCGRMRLLPGVIKPGSAIISRCCKKDLKKLN